MIELGVYRHYKGNEYEVIGVGKHTETLEDLVFYRALDGNNFWARPLGMFMENVPGTDKPRFQYIRDK